MIKQLDNVSENSNYTEEIQDEVSDEAQSTKRLMRFVELSDKSVKLGFSRLSRLLQIKRLPLDKIEEEILGTIFKHN